MARCTSLSSTQAIPSGRVFPIPFRDVLSQTGLRSVAATMKSLEKRMQVLPQMLLVIFEGDTIDSRCLALLQSTERTPQQTQVEQRKEVIENRFRFAIPLVGGCDPAELAPWFRHCVRPVSGLSRVLAWLTSLHQYYPVFSLADWFFGRRRYYAAIRLPESRLPPLLIRLVGHTQSSMSGMSSFVQELQGLTGLP